jgi:hypothetical protein
MKAKKKEKKEERTKKGERTRTEDDGQGLDHTNNTHNLQRWETDKQVD